MGVDQSVKTSVYVVRVIASFRKESWEAKIQGFWDLWVSESEVVEIFRKSLVGDLHFVGEERSAGRSRGFSTRRFEMGDLISDPSTFMCSVEKTYKPGLQILKVLGTYSEMASALVDL